MLSSKAFSLRELMINGNSSGSYNPQVLLRFTSLTKISLIMPSLAVIDILPAWLQKTGETLTTFHVVCPFSQSLFLVFDWSTSQMACHINDSALETMGQYMTQLKDLSIVGCRRITHRGILSILSHNTRRIESLGLEDLSSEFVSSLSSPNIITQYSAVVCISRDESRTCQPSQRLPFNSHPWHH